jgi:CheY-like chemotaxis protein
MSAAPWNVLIVDDEEDIHSITTIALRRKTWRGRPIVLRSARSGREASEILSQQAFHAALVDVVMETDDAGLRLCEFIRSSMPRTLRIVLRTGQPGAAPPERILQEYDIDHYLAKAEVNAERLFGTLRACFRSSLDIATLSTVSTQLRQFNEALRNPSATRATLVEVMLESLQFLGTKFGAEVAFVPDARDPAATAIGGHKKEDLSAAIAGTKPSSAALELLSGSEVGLAPELFVMAVHSASEPVRAKASTTERMKRWLTSVFSDDEVATIVSGVVVRPSSVLTSSERDELRQDLDLLVSNWQVADSSLRLQNKMMRERMEVAQHFGPRT